MAIDRIERGLDPVPPKHESQPRPVRGSSCVDAAGVWVVMGSRCEPGMGQGKDAASGTTLLGGSFLGASIGANCYAVTRCPSPFREYALRLAFRPARRQPTARASASEQSRRFVLPPTLSPLPARVSRPRFALGRVHTLAVRFACRADCLAPLVVREGIETVLAVVAEGERAALRLARRYAQGCVAASVLVPEGGDFNEDVVAPGPAALSSRGGYASSGETKPQTHPSATGNVHALLATGVGVPHVLAPSTRLRRVLHFVPAARAVTHVRSPRPGIIARSRQADNTDRPVIQCRRCLPPPRQVRRCTLLCGFKRHHAFEVVVARAVHSEADPDHPFISIHCFRCGHFVFQDACIDSPISPNCATLSSASLRA